MIFSSPEFLLFFFPLVLVVHWLVLGRVGVKRVMLSQHIFLLVASAYFYMSWNAKFILLISVSIVVDYFAGILIADSKSQARRRLVLIVSIVTNLGILAVFKYGAFALANVEHVARLFGHHTTFAINVILPVGISFYTFQSLSYTIDVYRGTLKPARNFVDFALFVLFFTHLVAGPIVPASKLLPQFEQPVFFRNVNVRRGVDYLLLGLVKKLLISDRLSPIADRLFSSPAPLDGVGAWVGVLAYTAQIYCDFSGYSDMAIGTAALLGYDLPTNFNMPYLSRNVTEFWKRWHISLSSWLRDYLYIPLGGNRDGALMTYRNLMLTMVLGGLWHGAEWTFVVWGALHALALVCHKVLARRFGPPRPAGPVLTAMRNSWKWAATFAFVCLTWTFFRAPTLAIAITVVGKLLFLEKGGSHDVPAEFFICLALLMAGHALGTRKFEVIERGKRLSAFWPVESIAYSLAAFVIFVFAPDGSRPFIYFQF